MAGRRDCTAAADRAGVPAAVPLSDGLEVDASAAEPAPVSAEATAGIHAIAAPMPTPATNGPSRREIEQLIGTPPGALHGPVGISPPARSASTRENLRH